VTERRKFIQKIAGLTAAFSAPSLIQQAWAANWEMVNQKAASLTPQELASNEDYWSVIQQAYTVNPNMVNLNNGGVSPSPRVVQEAVERFNQLSNEAPSYYMWRILDQGREPVRYKLATLAGCSPNEIAINRNATEALNTVIFGYPFKAGDEVIGTKQDYPNMIQAYRQIMPVKKIAAMAHARGIEVIVDGAHSFGLLDFKIPDLECDYFGTSLHKFLSAPIGSGMLWIQKDKIEKIWPLLCNDKPLSNDIRKFETLGTRSFPIEQGIGEAVNFHIAIGSKRKEERVRYLKNYWATKALQIPGVKIHTSLKDKYACGICGVTIDGMTPAALDGALYTNYKIHTVGIVWENISCVRITPHVYTRLEDLDKLITALTEIAAKQKG